jgi:sulfite exporter TauE/SafE/copper chaperone CopZ
MAVRDWERGLVTQELRIDGMTCLNCQARIERALANTAGVAQAQVSYRTATATVTFDPQAVTPKELATTVEQLGYRVLPKARRGFGNSQALGILIIVLAAFLLMRSLGAADIFNLFPTVETGMGFGMVFAIGLLTSLHCVAMCGGINLSQCMPAAGTAVNAAEGVRSREAAGADAGELVPAVADAGAGAVGAGAVANAGASSLTDTAKHKPATATQGSRSITTLRPSLLYNLGRVASYTLVGGIVGALGAGLTLTGGFRGVVQLLAGVFMVVMGLGMLGIIPGLRNFTPRLPRALAARIDAGAAKNKSPLIVGLLNGLMPCGPLQAMQLYALSTGSATTGALSMLLFALGTLPLMFGLGALSSLLTRRFTTRALRVGAALVVVLGLFMFSNGWNLSGLTLPVPNAVAGLFDGDTDGAGSEDGDSSGGVGDGAGNTDTAAIEGNYQVVSSRLASGKYPAITVQVGTPVRWTIDAPQGTINGCNNRFLIPEYDIEHQFTYGENVVEFTPTKVGTYPYSCWMGMIRSTVTVVEHI